MHEAPVQAQIIELLDRRFEPAHLEVLNESGNHNVPPGSETHFRVVVVSGDFDGKNLVQRHRAVNQTLGELLAGPVHALAIEAYTPGQWFETTTGPQPALQSPECLGGRAAELAAGTDAESSHS